MHATGCVLHDRHPGENFMNVNIELQAINLSLHCGCTETGLVLKTSLNCHWKFLHSRLYLRII